jgi:hypothetical protein
MMGRGHDDEENVEDSFGQKQNQKNNPDLKKEHLGFFIKQRRMVAELLELHG